MTPTSACTELHITFWNGIRYGKALVWGNTDALATLMTASDLSMPSSSTPSSLQAASSTFLPTSFRSCIMWPHHPGHKQMGSGTGISVNNYGPHCISLRTLQRHPALKSVNPRPLHISQEKSLWKQKPGSRASRFGASHDLECRRTAKKAAGGGREAVAWHKAQQ